MSRRRQSRQARRHAELLTQLAACWTYERFRHHLEGRESSDASSPAPSRLESIHARLTALEEHLEGGGIENLGASLDAVEHELRQHASQLLAEDSRLDASELRRFLTRVRRVDEEVLVGLLGFYILAHRDESWDPELVDKVDYLLSRLGEEVSGPLLERDLVRLRAALALVWKGAGSEAPPAPVLLALRQQIEAVRAELDGLATLDALEASRLIPRYRRLKHGLGRLLVEPSVAEDVLRTNAALSRAVRRLHAAEEGQIVADFVRLREIESSSGLSEALSLEIESLRRDMEVYEEGRRWDDVRLETLHRLRRQLRALQSDLEGMLASVPEEEGAASEEEGSSEAESRPAVAAEVADAVDVAETTEAPVSLDARFQSDLRWELVRRLYEELEEVVPASYGFEQAAEVLRQRPLPFDLGSRELAAFLALRDEGGAGTARHRLVFTGAAIRRHLVALRRGFEAGGEATSLRAVRRALGVAEDLLEELDEEVTVAEIAAESDWAAGLRFVRMELMRDYAELWLRSHGGD